MKEFQEFSTLYQKQKRYRVRVVGLAVSLLVLVTLFVLMNKYRINPLMLYIVAMGVVIFYAIKSRKVSQNYDALLTFLKKNKPKLLENKELLFFIDYEFAKIYEKNPSKLAKQLKSPKKKRKILKKIKEQETNYKLLTSQKKQSKKKRSRQSK